MRAISPFPSGRFITIVLLLAVLSACGGGNKDGDAAPTPRFLSQSTAVAAVGAEKVSGQVQGLNGVIATVVLGDQANLLMTTQTDSEGRFAFTGVPYGAFFVKAEAAGLQVSPPQTVSLSAAGPAEDLRPPLVFSASTANADSFIFHWDNVVGAHESAVPHVNAPPTIKYRDEVLPAPETSASASLLSTYNVTLSDKGVKWNQEYASRLLTLLGTIPTRNPNLIPTGPLFRISKWELTDQFMEGDIRIERNPDGDAVLLSTAAFVYATPRLVTLDGVQGRFFSKRLHHALVRFATQDGNDAEAVEQVLSQRFGVGTRIDNYQQLTGESAEKFAPFKPEELVTLINAMEEMPESFHKVNGLRYLVRRGYGYRNPDNPNIIAQARPSAGYIEFTDQALKETAQISPQRIGLHEKTHFLWANVFAEQLKADWIRLGGWYRDPLDAAKWKTGQTTQFVSAYAHDTNPDEDMAESVADYIVNPNLLQSRAFDKFNFLKERVFQGDRFVPVIRKDLTFDVFNLHPDYSPPGLVKRLDIKVQGAPAADKEIAATLELFGDGDFSPGARYCLITAVPPSGKGERSTQIYFLPSKDDGTLVVDVNRTLLKAQLTLSRYVESGYWQLTKGSCVDVTGNTRYLGASELGNASIYINNPQQSVQLPQYEPGSMSIQAAPVTVEGHVYHRITASWRISPRPPDTIFFSAELTGIDIDGGRRLAENISYDKATGTATAIFTIPDYYKSGRYGITSLQIGTTAGNITHQYFPDSVTNEQPRTVEIVNPNSDSGQEPELDLNRIAVVATPTQPAAPNGETLVKVAFYARDDAAGFSNLYINLLNPQGENMMFFFQVDPASPGGLAPGLDWGIAPFKGDPRAWRRYEATITLPVGSVPGNWGVRNMFMTDKAGFGKYYDFVEIVRFAVSAK